MIQHAVEETARSVAQQEIEANPGVMEQVRRLSVAIERQQAAIAQQQAEITALRAEVQRLQTGADDGATAGQMTGRERTHSTHQKRRPTSSRRALLKGAGAAAAATVALVASEGQSAHAGALIPANGVSWQTGTVNADNQTFVEPSNGSFPDPTLLTVRVGIAAPYGGLSSANSAAIAAYDTTVGGAYGLYATSAAGNGVYGLSGSSGSAGVVGAAGFGSGSYGVYGISDSSPGVRGDSGSNAGVEGTSTSGEGVFGTSSSSNGVHGHSDSSGGTGIGIGVWGESTTGRGVAGSSQTFTAGAFTSNSGIGVYALSNSAVSLWVDGPTAASGGRILQTVPTSAGAPTSGTYTKGEQIRDSSGELWLCVTSGTPGTWVRAAHVPNGYSGGAIAYLSKPIRLLDTRGSDPNALHNGGGPYTAPGSPYTLQIAGVNWMSVTVPSNAVGAIGKLTVVSGASGSGFVALVPSGSGTPTTGTLPYGASQIVATSFNVGLGGSPGAIDIYVGGTAVDVVIDLFAVVA